MEKVVVIGMWYVWFPTSCAIAKSWKYEVYWYDIVQEKIDNINAKIAPIDDKLAQEDIQSVNVIGTTSSDCLKDATYILICVPTPIDEMHNPDLWPVIWATQSIKKYLSKWQNIILESTVNPWVCDDTIIPILEETWLKCGIDFEVGHSPERINPWDEKWNVYNIPRNVWASTKEGTTRIANFFRSFLHAEINEMKDIKHAEATKIIENTFRDINIAYVNELAKSFDKLWLDIVDVIKWASNKPFAFMAHYPWCWVWWHCIAVDPYYLIEKAKKAWFDHKFLKIARETNISMPEYTVNKLFIELNRIWKPLKWTKVWLLWLSYKKDIADMRESPSFEILKFLKEYEADIEIFEPFNLEKSTCKSLDEILSKCEAVIIATNHTKFTKWLTIEKIENSHIKIILDWRNCLDKASFEWSGIIYSGIGR